MIIELFTCVVKCHVVSIPPDRQEALLAAISEKDANIALLELSSSKKKKTQDEVALLKREKDRLVQQLKQQVGRGHWPLCRVNMTTCVSHRIRSPVGNRQQRLRSSVRKMFWRLDTGCHCVNLEVVYKMQVFASNSIFLLRFSLPFTRQWRAGVPETTNVWKQVPEWNFLKPQHDGDINANASTSQCIPL